jgi:predicted ATP-dependent endonuclease of OLD family
MRLKAFKVEMFRPILDSGWCDIDDLTVIVGKNESGKTGLLKALHKFKPFKPEPYTLEREWPRGHRRERSVDKVVVQTRFSFDESEANEINKLLPAEDKPTGVEISKTYKGDYKYSLLPKELPTVATSNYILAQLRNRLSTGDIASEKLNETISQVKDKAIKLIEEMGHSALAGKIVEYNNFIDSAIESTNKEDKAEEERVKATLDELANLGNTNAKIKQIEELIFKWTPTFIYMDDHKPFQGIAYLNLLKEKKDQDQLTDQDKTFLMIFEMAGLDFEQEVQRATSQDKEQRMLDMNDASLTLTNLLADHWSQRKYQILFEADGHHVIAFVSDEVQPALVPLNERSKGFQWFFSFDTTFLYETTGTFKNAVILLDEPGLHLHAAAQRDFLKRLKEYAKDNQLIYTTHMPFMIDMERLDNIRVCTETKEHGTKVSADFYAADEHARFPLQAALGLSISQSLFVGPYNLVVEGITDFWLLSTMAAILRDENKNSLDERIVITPSGGATKAAYVGTMLQGQQLNVVVLLDSDPEGQRVADGLIKQWIMKDRHILLLGKSIGRVEETTLEDLFPLNFYLKFVNRAYAKEFDNNPLEIEEISANKQSQLVKRVDAALKARGIKPNAEGWAFNKGRPAKLMLSEMPKQKIADLPEEMVNRFEQLFMLINEAMPGLKNGPLTESIK